MVWSIVKALKYLLFKSSWTIEIIIRDKSKSKDDNMTKTLDKSIGITD